MLTNFKVYRRNHGITQEEAADLFNVSLGTVRKWEQCKSEPATQMIVAIAREFGCTVDELVGMESSIDGAKIDERTVQSVAEHEALELFRTLDGHRQSIILELMKAM